MKPYIFILLVLALFASATAVMAEPQGNSTSSLPHEHHHFGHHFDAFSFAQLNCPDCLNCPCDVNGNINCVSCPDSTDCINCQDCVGCHDLINSKNCINVDDGVGLDGAIGPVVTDTNTTVPDDNSTNTTDITDKDAVKDITNPCIST